MMFPVEVETISNIIHDDLELVRKSVRWFPKLLSNKWCSFSLTKRALFTQIVNENYIIGSLAMFLKRFIKKRTEMVRRE